MTKASTHSLSNSWKHTAGFLVKSCGKCCGSTVLYPSSHCILSYSEVCARVGSVNSQQFAGCVGHRQGCVLSRSFSYSTSAVGTYLLSRAA